MEQCKLFPLECREGEKGFWELQGFPGQSWLQNLSTAEEKIPIKLGIIEDIPSGRDNNAPHIKPDLSGSQVLVISQEKS